MKSVNVKLPKELEHATIRIFADWHLGDAHCDIDKIMAEIEQVKNDKSCYVILNGDLLNNATKTSVSDCYTATFSPMEQMKLLINLLEPIKDRILLATTGNHENRTYKQDNIDLTEIVMQELGLYDRYCANGGLLFIRLGRDSRHDSDRQQCYTIYATHGCGSGGGKKEGGKANRLAEMSSIVDADIYLHSHTHLPMIMRNRFYRVDYRNSSTKAVEKLFINTSAQLGYGGYGQMYEFKPASTESPILILSGKKHQMKATL